MATDFDGVHTDDRVLVDQHGVEAVRVSRRDGLGVALLREAGVPFVIVSKERNPVVGARAAKLKVDVLQGVDDKVCALTAWLDRAGLQARQVAYVGNDVNDLPVMAVGRLADRRRRRPSRGAAGRPAGAQPTRRATARSARCATWSSPLDEIR